MRGARSALVAACYVSFAAAFIGLLAQNRSLRRELAAERLLLVGRAGPLAKGQPLGSLKLLPPSGETLTLEKLLQGTPKLVYFYRPDCPHCKEQLPGWHEFLGGHSANEVVLVDCSPGTTSLGQADEMFPQLAKYHLASGPTIPARISVVPQLVAVDEQGIISATYESVDELLIGGSPRSHVAGGK